MRVGANGSRGLKELVELQVVVAERAGNRRAPGEIFADKGTDDVLLEALLLVDDVVGDAQMLGYAAGVVDVVEEQQRPAFGASGIPCLPARRG